MGFSVSGAAAIVFAGLVLGFGIFYGAASDSFERVSEAQDGRSDRAVDERNAAINVTETEHVGDRLTVHVNNTGATPLGLNETDFLVDNEYRTGWEESANVTATDGTREGETYLWLPGERLNITIQYEDVPARAKVVTGTGVADTEVFG